MFCLWTFKEDKDHFWYYLTGCKETHDFMFFKDNYKYCPFCSKEIQFNKGLTSSEKARF